jgi:2-isopropylmalate synthase
MNAAIELLDTTLRDGAQGEGISFSVHDKLSVAEALDELGVAWIEAGNPGSNPKDAEFFARAAKELRLKTAALCAFGATRKKGVRPEDDAQLTALLQAETETVVIFGKSWDLHTREVLKVSLEENLAMIGETISFLVKAGRRVIYDAEHFFDGWKANPAYALKTLRAAHLAGAYRLVLCDTNGGSFPEDIVAGLTAAHSVPDTTARDATAAHAVTGGVPDTTARDAMPPLSNYEPGGNTLRVVPEGNTLRVGIHAHNDMGLALACSLAALRAGCTHVQGTLAGFGERCGNTPLAALIPTLELKMGVSCIAPRKLPLLTEITRRIAEIANISVPEDMPYIGAHAFSHKAGMHTDAIIKVRESFEHITPALVGNDRRFLMSEMGGRAAIVERVKTMALRWPAFPVDTITKEHPVIAALSAKLKELEAEGWQFEGADASFELLARRAFGNYCAHFEILAYRVQSEHPNSPSLACSHAWVKVLVDGQTEIAADEGDGPVNALDGALRRALLRFYPQLHSIRLSDYKVRVIDGNDATAARVRVLIESTDGQNIWMTAGVSADIIDASRAALADSIEYKLSA